MKTCKIVVVPHVAKGPRETSRKTFDVSDDPDSQGWRDAMAHAKTGDTTVYLVCAKTKVRMATCTENNRRISGTLCRIDGDLNTSRRRRKK